MAENKPLKGKRILLTREDNSRLRAGLETLGASVLEIPMIRAVFPPASPDLSDALKGIGSYDWLVFSSRNGVKGFFDAFFSEYDDIRAIGILNIACVGEGTALALGEYYLRADCIPEKSNAMAMAEAMEEMQTLENLKILNVRGDRVNEEFEKCLSEKYRAIVDSVSVYSTEVLSVSKEDAADFREKGADFVVFASGSAVEGFAKNAKVLFSGKAKAPKIVAIGNSTAEVLKKFSLKASAVAKQPTREAVEEALVELAKNGLQSRRG